MLSAIVGEALWRAVGPARWAANAAGLPEVAEVLGSINLVRRQLQAQEAGQEVVGGQAQPSDDAVYSNTVDADSGGEVAIDEASAILDGLVEAGKNLLGWLSELA